MESFNVEDNFWKVHPDLVAAGPFAQIHKVDKTRGKDYSSKLAWCIKLIWDMGSVYYALPERGEDNKIDLVFEDFLGKPNFYDKNREQVNDLKEFYIKVKDTVAHRTLRGIEEKLKERDAFMSKTEYDMGVVNERGAWVGNTVDTLDKMMANTKKLYDLYNEARAVVDREQQKHSLGNTTQSLSDAGDI